MLDLDPNERYALRTNNFIRARYEEHRTLLNIYLLELLYPSAKGRNSQVNPPNMQIYLSFLRLRYYITTGVWPNSRNIPLSALKNSYNLWKKDQKWRIEGVSRRVRKVKSDKKAKISR